MAFREEVPGCIQVKQGQVSCLWHLPLVAGSIGGCNAQALTIEHEVLLMKHRPRRFFTRAEMAKAEDRAVPEHWEGDLFFGSDNSQIATPGEK
jgi:hypothetical protein